MIQETDLPGLYQASDRRSLRSQRFYKGMVWLLLVLMLLSTLISSLGDDIRTQVPALDAVNGWILVVPALVSVLFLSNSPERGWYVGRAMAESLKTLSWRYMMRSAPFNGNEKEAADIFATRLQEVLRAAQKDGFVVTAPTGTQEISPKMLAIRREGFALRKAIYAQHRIDNQLEWYEKKSKANHQLAIRYHVLIVVFLLFAVLYLFLWKEDLRWLNANEVLVFLATSFLSLLELNKYKELHQSYAFTASELRIIKGKAQLVNNDRELDEFVAEAELAISREHTTWTARRGSSHYGDGS